MVKLQSWPLAILGFWVSACGGVRGTQSDLHSESSWMQVGREDTFLKKWPDLSVAQLRELEAAQGSAPGTLVCPLPAEARFAIQEPATFVENHAHHVINLSKIPEGCGFSRGFVFHKHVTVSSVQETLDIVWPVLRIGGGDTFLKKWPDLSVEELRQRETVEGRAKGTYVCALYAGSSYVIDGVVTHVSNFNHYLLSTRHLLPGCGFSRGYVFKPDVAVEGATRIPAMAISWPSLKVEADGGTMLKATTESASVLLARERDEGKPRGTYICTMYKGQVYSLREAPKGETAGHLPIALRLMIPGCSMSSGFVFGKHVSGLESGPKFPVKWDGSHFASHYASSDSTASFGAGRDGGRIHAGCDLYQTGDNGYFYHSGYYSLNRRRPVYAVSDGTVVDHGDFYQGTDFLVVDHGNFVVRYGEISKAGLPSGVGVGSRVRKGQLIAWTGDLAMSTGAWSMLHFEIFSGSVSGPLTDLGNFSYSFVPDANYQRRSDLQNCMPYLTQWEDNQPD